MFHRIKTIDTNINEIREMTIYCQAKFGLKPYMMKDGLSIFRDVVIQLTDKAGEV